MTFNIQWGKVFGLSIAWDFVYDKEILIFLPFIVIILNFGSCKQ